ncbi:chaperone protein dnaJ 49 [Artemisia annua]|uniref:Chaperone protein dnaJ 49 n=1 Tax=Artemisia annua TaxID=35608 RepID=A0A2U1LBZ9_ARTAN|nr:chaperone protein dnaJ 49 [Artemisia annua]
MCYAMHGNLNKGYKQSSKASKYMCIAEIVIFCVVLVSMGLFAFLIFNSAPKTKPPYYSLERKDEYQIPMMTKKYGIEFYVRSSDEFDTVYRSFSRSSVEKRITIRYIQALYNDCRYEIGTSKLLWRIRREDFPTPSCDKLDSMDIQIYQEL